MAAHPDFDPIASPTTPIADHREPAFVHPADVEAAQGKLDGFTNRHGGKQPTSS
ncbi:MAG: hypothetical protein R2711_14580 [Acidimicrobiales bacterium]